MVFFRLIRIHVISFEIYDCTLCSTVQGISEMYVRFWICQPHLFSSSVTSQLFMFILLYKKLQFTIGIIRVHFVSANLGTGRFLFIAEALFSTI